MGYLIPVLIPSINSRIKMLIFALCTSIFIEAVQQITQLGMLDVFDVIFNTIGACIGWKVYAKWLLNENRSV